MKLLIWLMLVLLTSCSSTFYKDQAVIATYSNGYVMNPKGKVMGTYSNGYILNPNDELIGTYSNGYVLNNKGEVVATYSNGYVMDGESHKHTFPKPK